MQTDYWLFAMRGKVIYDSKMINSVNTVHIRTFELDKADAEGIFEHLKSTAAEFGLKLQNLVMLSSDGPNFNKNIMSLMKTHVKEERGFELLDVGFCWCHVLHDSLKKGTEKLEICDLVYFVYEHFTEANKWDRFIQFVKPENH
jgi:hypothetical protein